MRGLQRKRDVLLQPQLAVCHNYPHAARKLVEQLHTVKARAALNAVANSAL